MSLDNFLDYRQSDLRLPVRLYLRDGKIIINEIPTVIRATVIALFNVLMGSWNCQDLRYGVDTTMILNHNNVKEPDLWVRPVRRPRPPLAQAMDRFGTPYPIMIVEVGYTQGLPDMHRKVEFYFDVRTTIQIVLTIKIYEPRVDHTAAMIAALYLRTSPSPLIPVDVRSFGTSGPANVSKYYVYNDMGVPHHIFMGVGLSDINNNPFPPCAMAGIPAYQMNIPATELFDGDPAGVPASAIGGFNLDLWEFQVVIRESFNIP